MSDRHHQATPFSAAIIGYSQAIGENLARIDASLPPVPLPVSLHTEEPIHASLPSDSRDAVLGIDPAGGSPPAPRGQSAPRGRVPLTKPRSTRRSTR